ncbi:hypothetical protein C8J56DRAFT_356742 [Mycena floridula]|nr:hypothetical protein C8J56DRAFT_356742 [Mycena floridula]
MPPNLNALISGARKGNVDDIRQLVEHLFDAAVSNEPIQVKLWPILLHHIQTTQVPTKEVNETEISLPYYCFFGLMVGLRPNRIPGPFNGDEAYKQLTSRAPINTHRSRQILDIWPRFWDWVLYFFRRPPVGALVNFRHPISEVVTSVVSHISVAAQISPRATLQTQFFEAVSGTKAIEFTSFAMDAWMTSVKDLGLALEPPAITSGIVVNALEQVDEPLVIDLIAKMEYHPDTPSTCLDAAIIALGRRNIWPGELLAPLRILDICSARSNKLAEIFLSFGSIPVALRILKRLCQPDPKGQILDILLPFLTRYLGRTLVYTARDGIGRPWIIQTLDAGFLRCIVKLSHRIHCTCGLASGTEMSPVTSKAEVQFVVQLIEHLRGLADQDEAVLRAFKREFRRIDAQDLSKQYAAKNGKPCIVWDAWSAFRTHISLELRFLKQFHSQKHRICAYALCRAPESYFKDAKRCSGCQLKYYCSRVCQKAHWKEEHRNICPKQLIRYPGTPLLESDLDKSFRKWLAIFGQPDSGRVDHLNVIIDGIMGM